MPVLGCPGLGMEPVLPCQEQGEDRQAVNIEQRK